MELLVGAAFLAPLLLLILVLTRHARRIRTEAIDKERRTQHLERINAALVRYVLERDRRTCRTCGSKDQVGIDFVAGTPEEGKRILPEDLEARCSGCYAARWKTLPETSDT